MNPDNNFIIFLSISFHNLDSLLMGGNMYIMN